MYIYINYIIWKQSSTLWNHVVVADDKDDGDHENDDDDDDDDDYYDGNSHCNYEDNNHVMWMMMGCDENENKSVCRVDNIIDLIMG